MAEGSTEVAETNGHVAVSAAASAHRRSSQHEDLDLIYGGCDPFDMETRDSRSKARRSSRREQAAEDIDLVYESTDPFTMESESSKQKSSARRNSRRKESEEDYDSIFAMCDPFDLEQPKGKPSSTARRHSKLEQAAEDTDMIYDMCDPFDLAGPVQVGKKSVSVDTATKKRGSSFSMDPRDRGESEMWQDPAGIQEADILRLLADMARKRKEG
mmetsp:Transcript_34104/g.77801  ORF Transcript_34104/g.77801 Transcript_34104/m.77801 type:complete len:214 (+) Transcript_34104:70-711(+)